MPKGQAEALVRRFTRLEELEDVNELFPMSPSCEYGFQPSKESVIA